MIKRHQRRAAVLFVGLHPELKDIVEKAATARGQFVNEHVASILAERFARPDLAVIPRTGVGGRPRKNPLPA